MSWFKCEPQVNHYQEQIDLVRRTEWVPEQREYDVPKLLVNYKLKDGSVIQEYRRGDIQDTTSLGAYYLLTELSKGIEIQPDFKLAKLEIEKLLIDKKVHYKTTSVWYSRPVKELLRENELVRIKTSKEEILVKFEDLDVVTFEEVASEKITHEILVKIEK